MYIGKPQPNTPSNITPDAYLLVSLSGSSISSASAAFTTIAFLSPTNTSIFRLDYVRETGLNRNFEPPLSLSSVVSGISGSPVTTTSALTSTTSTSRQSFPTVIVVNPTSHPTPPATPSPDESNTQFDQDSHATRRKDREILPTAAEGSQGRVVDTEKGPSSSEGKEREVGGCQEDELGASVELTINAATRAKSLPLHRSTLYHQHPVLQLRQLPTNPPRRQPSPGRRNNAESTETQLRANSSQAKSEVHETPYHPPLGPLALGHLPSIPPRPRPPIEITEKSTDYSTTDMEGDYSSWELESVSEGGNVQTESQPGPSRPNQKGIDSLKSERKAVATSCNNNRIRDPGEFARDAVLEAQRQKALFQKLPERSYSNVGQLLRTRSGLSQLFRSDPRSFPEGHPYLTCRTSQDLLALNWSSPAPPLAMTAVTKRTSVVEPVEAAVNVSSVKSKTDVSEMVNSERSNTPQRKYEDSEDEDPEDVIQISRSISKRRLAALVGARARGMKSMSHPRKPSPAQVDTERADTAPSAQPIARTATMPVTIHPFFPEPAPVKTPHTILRNIISKELDAELRRNLVLERSQNQVQGRPPRTPGSILPAPWRGLTPLRSNENTDSQVASTTDRPDNRLFATQRTKSWAGDSHASGWENNGILLTQTGHYCEIVIGIPPVAVTPSAIAASSPGQRKGPTLMPSPPMKKIGEAVVGGRVFDVGVPMRETEIVEMEASGMNVDAGATGMDVSGEFVSGGMSKWPWSKTMARGKCTRGVTGWTKDEAKRLGAVEKEGRLSTSLDRPWQ
ncbi:hypothetical protein BU17DRAFT_70532 [Hysterangium stoloniferum]|nr:hypothetical protein BU17DRAFT_70532 [Hysterangium stoloniferum]